MHSRRTFIHFALSIGATHFTARHALSQQRPLSDHPDPRPGVDASRVISTEQLKSYPDVADAYEGIRRIPHIADGIRCRCGCADAPGMRSLLTCYESNGMALYCEICQGEGRMVVRLHEAGRSLDQIREAVDARFGRGDVDHHRRR